LKSYKEPGRVQIKKKMGNKRNFRTPDHQGSLFAKIHPNLLISLWFPISKTCKLPLLLLDSGVKIYQDYYIEHVLHQHLLLHATTITVQIIYFSNRTPQSSHNGNEQKRLAKNLLDLPTWTSTHGTTC
jgi:hypothetical protein